MKKWRVEITKQGTDYSICNDDYNLYLGDSFSGTPLRFNAEKGEKLYKDAKKLCKILNKGDIQ